MVGDYSKFTKAYEGTYAVLYDCSAFAPHVAVGVWRGFFELSQETFINDMWRSIEFIRDKQIIAIISDHSDLKVVSSDVLDWLHKNWYSNARKHGLRVEAALSARSAVANLSLKQMLNEAKTGKVSTPLFPDFQSAYDFCREFIRNYQAQKQ